MIRSRDVKVGGNNFPVKLESDQDKDFQVHPYSPFFVL